MNNSLQKTGNQIAAISNALHTGEYSDFRSAVKVLIKAYRLEKSLCESCGEIGDPAHWDDCIRDAQRSLDIYNKAIKDAEQKAAQQMDDEGLSIFAEAAEQGSYEGLAF